MNNSEVRSEDTLQPVKYLGKENISYARGIGIAVEPTRLVWKRSKSGSLYNRCAISIDHSGLSVYEEIAKGTYKSVWRDAIENISYCVAEPLHRRIFAWISRLDDMNQLECHIVLCKTSKQAHLLAELLAKVFYDPCHYMQKPSVDLAPKLSNNCAVCETITQNQKPNLNSFSYRNGSQRRLCYDDSEDQQQTANYQQKSYRQPTIARVFVQNYEDNINMNNSRPQSFDYDSILPDKNASKPTDYYRR